MINFVNILQTHNAYYGRSVVKILSGWIFNIVFQASVYSQVILKSTDPSQQFSAPFKAGNSRQAQACYIP